MNSNSKNTSQSAAVSSAPMRRLFLERLEVRSVLATMFGQGEFSALSAAVSAGDVEWSSVKHLRTNSAFLLSNADESEQVTLTPFKFDAWHLPQNEHAVVVATDVVSPIWTNLPAAIDVAPGENIAQSDVVANLQLSKGWFSIIRPGLVRPIEIRDRDLSLDLLPANVDQSPDATTLDGPTSETPTDSPLQNDLPTSTQPATTPGSIAGQERDGDTVRLASEFKVEAATGTVSLHSADRHGDEPRHTLKSQLTSRIDRQPAGESELAEFTEANEQPDQLELAGTLLEFTGSRNLRTNADYLAQQKADGMPATYRSSAGTVSGTHWLGPQPVGEHAALVVEIQPDVLNSFDEGGMVELLAAESFRNKHVPGGSGGAGALRSEMIDAEVDIFQAIDVAAAFLDEPSHAVIAPIALVIAFQLFDRRRQMASEEEFNWQQFDLRSDSAT